MYISLLLREIYLFFSQIQYLLKNSIFYPIIIKKRVVINKTDIFQMIVCLVKKERFINKA